MDLTVLWEKVQEFALTGGIRLVSAILLVVIGFAVCNRFLKLIKRARFFKKMDKSAKNFIIGFLGIIVKVVIVLTAMSIIGIPMTNAVAIISSCGLAIGLALQGSLSNFAGGLMLLVFKPFKTGDFIESSGVSGKVKDVSILYTHILTPDNKLEIIPNGTLSNAIITNYSAEKTRRYDAVISVAYETDIEDARDALLSVANSIEGILPDPAPEVIVNEYADSSIQLILRVWMNTDDYWPVVNTIKKKIKPALDSKNVEIPYPQVVIHNK